MVGNLTGIVAIAGGEDSGYAATSDGAVWAWGDNAYGQLGVGASPASASDPLLVNGLTGVASVASTYVNGYALVTR